MQPLRNETRPAETLMTKPTDSRPTPAVPLVTRPLQRRLPPLNALRSFEAAARHLSFAKAAGELHVTPAAISHQVKVLEDFLGIALFRRVLYPGRADHPQHALAGAQMSGGGSLIAFEIDGDKAATFAVVDRLRLIDISNNLGDAKSLITHPSTTTHQRLTPEARAELGIADNLLRLSVGLEDALDIMEDLDAALAQ